MEIKTSLELLSSLKLGISPIKTSDPKLVTIIEVAFAIKEKRLQQYAKGCLGSKYTYGLTETAIITLIVGTLTVVVVLGVVALIKDYDIDYEPVTEFDPKTGKATIKNKLVIKKGNKDANIE